MDNSDLRDFDFGILGNFQDQRSNFHQRKCPHAGRQWSFQAQGWIPLCPFRNRVWLLGFGHRLRDILRRFQLLQKELVYVSAVHTLYLN